jgi:hypothetical protein
MFKVTTDMGDFAVKWLNATIMRWECVLNNNNIRKRGVY